MSHLLYIEASPMQSASTSRAVARAWLDAWCGAHPGATIDVLNVWDLPLPAFDADMIAAKFAVLRAQQASAEQLRLWGEAVAISRRFNAADEYLFSLPMWNFGVPYRLKHFIDVVTLPGQNWRWSRERGYESLLCGKQATLVYSSAGDYRVAPHEDGSDFQKPFMRRWLRFLGIAVAGEISASPTLAPAADVEAMAQRALASAHAAGAAQGRDTAGTALREG